MFSNKFLKTKVLFAGFLLLAMGVYSDMHGRKQDTRALAEIKHCMTTPLECTTLLIVMRVRIKGLVEDAVEAEVKIGRHYASKKTITLTGLVGEPSPGRIVDILGSYAEDASFSILRQYESDWVQHLKYWISVAGLLVVFFFLRHHFQRTTRVIFPLIPRSKAQHHA